VAPSGAIRVLEAPKPRLRAVQRRLLHEVAALIPPHDAARGFRPGGSVRSYAAPHADRPVVLRLDLEAFFASVTVSRVYGIWRSAGYPEPVAHCLAGLANLAAHELDVRLTALARSWGGRYTRYADDLAFSGDRGWGTGTSRLVDAIEEIVHDEGFRLNARKTGVMPRAGRQVLGGLVVNERPKVARREVDVLKAILHNCHRFGPSTQNRDDVPDFEEHLRGRIAWVAQHDPVRGARLQAVHDAVDWSR
jgi:hypothetical protein